MPEAKITTIDKFVKADFLKGLVSSTRHTDSDDWVSKQPVKKNKRLEELGSYIFSWGQIYEHLVGSYFVVWRFSISTLTTNSDEHITYRSRVYSTLESQFPEFSSEQAVLVAGLYDSWCIYPGTSTEMFSIVTTLETEDDAREWVLNNIINKALPEILKDLNNGI